MAIGEQYGGLLAIGDVARMLNVHINTVRRWSNQGILSALRIGPRGDRRYKMEEVTLFLGKLTGKR
jgi:DNA-binding transcriptional MerR regulator